MRKFTSMVSAIVFAVGSLPASHTAEAGSGILRCAMPDGSFMRRHVSLGRRDSGTYDIASGLASGDRIVADGAIFLQFMQSQ